jgi:anti-sigma factor RsiW
MTMPNAPHPDDERLAAYADADRDVLDDRSLHEHLAGCARCFDLVADLTSLRSALAELPDIAPSRPLRLLPPAPVVTPSRGELPWLRRLVAPTIAVGIGLMVVGGVGVGTAGLFRQSGASLLSGEAAGGSPRASSAGQQPAAESSSTDSMDRGNPSAAFGGRTSQVPAPTSVAPSASHVPVTVGQGGDKSTNPEATPTPTAATKWLVVLVAGVALILVGLVLRFSLQPRAG